MLILTRRVGETLCIGGDITVTVLGLQGKQVRLGLQGKQVRLGIHAPEEVRVDREEVRHRIERGEPFTPKAAAG